MSDSNESSRQATHARQEGVDDNVAALAGPVVDNGDAPAPAPAPDMAVTADTVGGKPRWSSAINAARSALGGPKDGADAEAKPAISGRWVAAASMGIGSAALVAALLYANRSRDKDAKSDGKPNDKQGDKD